MPRLELGEPKGVRLGDQSILYYVDQPVLGSRECPPNTWLHEVGAMACIEGGGSQASTTSGSPDTQHRASTSAGYIIRHNNKSSEETPSSLLVGTGLKVLFYVFGGIERARGRAYMVGLA
jgi:hypothetical protein